MKLFNTEKYNLARLKPLAIDVELNKCTHSSFNEATGHCEECGVAPIIEMDMASLAIATKVVIGHIETYKMIGKCLTKKERKLAQKYFDMIPLLKNLNSLHDVCEERYEEAIKLLDGIDEDNTEEEKSNCSFLKALALEDEDDEEESCPNVLAEDEPSESELKMHKSEKLL